MSSNNARGGNAAPDSKEGPFALAAGLAIPSIQSAALNIGTAASAAAAAIECWDDEKWSDSVMWINDAIAQLESARAKITAHASSPNDRDQPTRRAQVES